MLAYRAVATQLTLPENFRREGSSGAIMWLIGLVLVGSVLNTYASIVNEVDLNLIDLYKKKYGEDSIVKVYHRNKKHYATKEPLVHYEILVVAESFYNTPMVDVSIITI